jgi:hypothetical protein
LFQRLVNSESCSSGIECLTRDLILSSIGSYMAS